MPVAEIAKHIKRTYNNSDNVKIVVDGAHGLLAQEVVLSDLASTGVDFYVANGHKWLAAPRGVGMLFCPNADLRDTILSEPAIVSHGVDEADLLSRFVWDGCRDYAAALAIPAVLDYWENRDLVNTRDEMRQGMMQGIQCLADHWHQGCPQNMWLEEGVILVPTSLLSPMALVSLPPNLCGSPRNKRTSEDAKNMQDYLYDNQIEVPIKCINGQLFVRVSNHVYNEVKEFDLLGKVLLRYQYMR